MLTTVTNSLALFRFGAGRGGGGIVSLLLLLAVAVVIAWALTRTGGTESNRAPKTITGGSLPSSPPERTDA